MRQVLVLAIVLWAAAAGPARAQTIFSITGEDTVGGNAGFIVEVEDVGFGTEEFFTFVEDGKVRIYAFREPPSPFWIPLPYTAYLVAQDAMSVGMTWRFIDGDLGGSRTCEVLGMEAVSTLAGDFDAWKVQMTEDAGPGDQVDYFYWVEGVGFVKNTTEYLGVVTYRSELSSYSATGSGFFPLVVGNTWTYVGGDVDNESSSVGALKKQYVR